MHQGCVAMKHRRSWEGATLEFDTVARALVPCLSFFFIYFLFHRFAPTRLQFAPIWPESGHIGRIGSYWLVIETTEISLESCQNSWILLWMRPKYPKSVIPQFYYEYLLLILCFHFCFVFLAFFFLCFVNQGIVIYFLRIFYE